METGKQQHVMDWKDGEYGYCVELVKMGGCASVPASAVASYLHLQCADAARDGRLDVVQAFNRLIEEWAQS